MSPSRRNIVVGVVVLAALVALAWMILQFANKASQYFLAKGVPVRVITGRADGIAEGSPVFYKGVEVGRVVTMKLSENAQNVVIDLLINESELLPGNLVAVINVTALLGASGSINLQLTGPPTGRLGANATLKGDYRGSSFIPPEFATLAADINNRKLIEHLDATIVSIRNQSERAGKLIESMNDLVADPKKQEDLRKSIENFRKATESAVRIGDNLEKVSTEMSEVTSQASQTLADSRRHMEDLKRQIAGNIEQIGGVLKHVESITGKIDKGDGTAGMLVNDPRLYESLVDTAQQLNATTADLKRLVEQWEEEGVTLKLNK